MIIIGDIHGIREIFNLIDKYKWTNQNLIQVGDFGLGFQEIMYDVENLKYLDEALIDTNNKLYVIRGNHDNPIFWDKSKGLWLPKFHNLELVEDYTLREIEDKKVLFVGGGISIDRQVRKLDIPPSWWEYEGFFYNFGKMRMKTKFGVDIVITHSAPDFAHPSIGMKSDLVDHYHKLELQHGNDLKEDLKEEREGITEMYNDLTIELDIKPKYWCYGHFHKSYIEDINGTTFKLLNINETYEI